ncbi:MAG: PD40 domain-containing protein, partial [Bacteroidetes bacterium]|nr:PD40 domain-containing protein [Bacteroidota bacterium]
MRSISLFFLFWSILSRALPVTYAQSVSGPSFEDVLSLRSVGNPMISPNGNDVAFTIRTVDWKENEYDTEIWLAPDGEEPFQLTRTADGSSSSPRWSPDGKWIAFAATRGEKQQIFVIRPNGGEAQAITDTEEGVGSFRWSPDGSRFAVTGVVEGERALYWRSADGESFRVVPGTENAQGATFSPDGDWIAYGTLAGALYKVSLSGGAPNLLVREGSLSQGMYLPHWGDDGTIVFANPGGSYRIPDTGGEYVRISRSEPIIHPHLLPGGWAALGSRITGGLVLMDLTSDTIRQLNSIGHEPKYVETGHLLYLDDAGGLWALPFDAANGDVLGDAVPILDGVSTPAAGAFRFPRYSISRNGTLVYGAGAPGGSAEARRLLILDLQGNPAPVGLTPRDFDEVRWSP